MSKYGLVTGMLNHRLQSMFDLVRLRLGLHLPNIDKEKWKGTIGIVGLDPNLVAKLNINLIKRANSLGLMEDQHIPEIITVGVPTHDIRLLESQVDICKTAGADVIAFAQTTADSQINSKLQERFHIPVFSMDSARNMHSLVDKTLDYAVKIEHPKRPDIRYRGSESEMISKLQEDARDRNKRMNQSKSYGGYPVLSDPFIGIIGGAGPFASAQLSEMLAKEGTNYVHFSSNSAPGKHLYEIGNGPSYVPTYKSTYEFLMNLGAHKITVPCNTAHMRLEEFSNNNPESILDIRTSVLDVNRNETGFILLGTNRTVGVNCDGKIGLYEELRSKYPDQGPFYIPNESQQQVILDAIFDIKAGKLLQAKNAINNVISGLRSQYGEDLKVILGCTELPLAYTDLEIAEHSLIDPAYNLAQVAKKSISQENVRRNNETPNPILKEVSHNTQLIDTDKSKDSKNTSGGRD